MIRRTVDETSATGLVAAEIAVAVGLQAQKGGLAETSSNNDARLPVNFVNHLSFAFDHWKYYGSERCFLRKPYC